MKKYAIIYILIILSVFMIGGCAKDTSNISGTTMDFKVEAVGPEMIMETITIDFAQKDYSSTSKLNDDRNATLGYFMSDTEYYWHEFCMAVEHSALPDDVKLEYQDHSVTFEPKYINNTFSIMFEVVYKNSGIRSAWYEFVGTFDGTTGRIINYHDDTPVIEEEDPLLEEEGRWFNKTYVMADSVYKYAFIPYPTFVQNFVAKKNNVTYTQTLITQYDDLNTNAIVENLYEGDIVERTWVIDIANDNQQIEYYILRANRVSWYILALAISLLFVALLFIIALIKFINKRRAN